MLSRAPKSGQNAGLGLLCAPLLCLAACLGPAGPGVQETGLEPLGERPIALIRERLEHIDTAFETIHDTVAAQRAGGRLFALCINISSPRRPYVELLVTDALGSAPRSLGASDPIGIESSPDGSYVAVLAGGAGGPAWQLLDAESGAAIGPELAADGQAQPALIWLPGASGVCYSSVRQSQTVVIRREFASGTDEVVWSAPDGLLDFDLRGTDDGSQLLVTGRFNGGATDAWLVDLYGSTAIEIAALFPQRPARLVAIGTSGPLAFLLALDDERGDRVVAVDRRRRGAPPLTILTVKGQRIRAACLAGGKLVVHRMDTQTSAESIAVYAPSGALERVMDLPLGHSIEQLRGSAHAPFALAIYRSPLMPRRAARFNPLEGGWLDAQTGGQKLATSPVTSRAGFSPELTVRSTALGRYEQIWTALGGTINQQPTADNPRAANLDDLVQRLAAEGLVPTARAAAAVDLRRLHDQP